MAIQDQFLKLKQDLHSYIPIISNASDAILDQGVSSYPIFVAHQHDVAIGIPIIEKQENGSNWSIHASTLEELVTKKIISPEKLEAFRSVFKPPTESLCFFVLSENGAQFVFIPRQKD